MEKDFYIIATGEGSDYRIVGITENWLKANNYCKMFPNCMIERYEDNIADTSPFVGLNAYTVSFYVLSEHYRPGTVITKREKGPCYIFNKYVHGDVEWDEIEGELNVWTAYVLAKDAEHAQKIGMDRIEIEWGRKAASGLLE